MSTYESSPDNYTLGKGIVSFNKRNIASGLYTGERDLGNAPAFSFSTAIEKLEHFSSRGGLRAKDKEIISQITPSLSFTLDEIQEENLALLTLGTVESVDQAGVAVIDEAITGYAGKASQLSKRKIGATTLAHDEVVTGPFVVGETVTGGTSTATGEIVAVETGYIQVVVTSGTFVNAEAITATGGATANTTADPVFVAGVVKVTDSTGTTTYVAGTDYRVDTTKKDDQIGRIWVIEGGSITEGEPLLVTFGCEDYTYKVVRAFKETQIEGFLRFVSDNPTGGQRELRVWRCSLTPTGDTALIGEDWATLGFSGEILKDEAGHPESPYMDIVAL